MPDEIKLKPKVKVRLTKYTEGSAEPAEVVEHELNEEEAQRICHLLQQE